MTREEILEAAKVGMKAGARYLVVARDGFDGTHYPLYANGAETLREVLATHPRERPFGDVGDRAVEVYDLAADLGPQLAAERCWSVPS